MDIRKFFNKPKNVEITYEDFCEQMKALPGVEMCKDQSGEEIFRIDPVRVKEAIDLAEKEAERKRRAREYARNYRKTAKGKEYHRKKQREYMARKKAKKDKEADPGHN